MVDEDKNFFNKIIMGNETWCFAYYPETKQQIVEQSYTNLMSLALLFRPLLLNMFRMLVHPSSGACDLLWIYFMCCIAL